MEKIKKIKELAEILKRLRNQGKKIVHCHGVFDLLHIGHTQLHSEVVPYFAVQDGAPTLIKRRFIEGYSLNKLFEVYAMDDSGLAEDKDLEVCDWLRGELPKYDLVIAADFGHGTVSDNMVRVLRENARFLAVKLFPLLWNQDVPSFTEKIYSTVRLLKRN